MDEDTSEINGFQPKEAFNSNIFYLDKKRKIQPEQLALPISKHKCWDHRFPLGTSKINEENEEEKDLIAHINTKNVERRAIDEGLYPESAKDSNSFVEDSDFAMSMYGEVKFERKVSKIWPPDRPPISPFSCSSFKDAQYSSNVAAAPRDAGKEELISTEGEHDQRGHDDGLQVSQNLEEPILEFESPLAYGCSEFGTDSIETCTDKELDILYSNGVNPNVYALSSGRYAANQDAQSGPRKPTIDQEFEQYFSFLML